MSPKCKYSLFGNSVLWLTFKTIAISNNEGGGVHEYVYMWKKTERKTDLDQVLITYLEAEFTSTNNQCNQKKRVKENSERNVGGRR